MIEKTFHLRGRATIGAELPVRSVVAGEYNKGIFLQMQLLQRFPNPAHRPCHLIDRVAEIACTLNKVGVLLRN